MFNNSKVLTISKLLLDRNKTNVTFFKQANKKHTIIGKYGG